VATVALMSCSNAAALKQDPLPQLSDVATVQGTIRDTDGMPVALATVCLEEKGNSKKVETKTNANGVFVFSSLRAGTYRLSSKKAPLRSPTTEAFLLSEGDHKHIDLVLEASEAIRANSEAMQFSDQPNFTVAAGLTTTFAGLNVGASGTNKQTLACVQQGDMGGVTSVTMNGTPMTLVTDSTAADLVFGPNTSGSQLYEAPHPAGATATFAVTLASLGPTNAAVGIQVGSLTTTHPSPVASGAALWATGLVLSPPVTIPSFGIAIMCVVSFGTIPTMPGTSAVWLNGTQDNYSVNSFPAFLFGGLAHLYSSGSQQPAVSGVNGFGQAVGVWQP